MRHRLANAHAQLQPLVEPVANLRHHAHDGRSSVVVFGFSRTVAMRPGVGISPARISNSLPSTLYASSNSPLSGGPDAPPPPASQAPPQHRPIHTPPYHNPPP